MLPVLFCLFWNDATICKPFKYKCAVTAFLMQMSGQERERRKMEKNYNPVKLWYQISIDSKIFYPL